MNKANAIQSLRPGAQFVLTGDTLEWHDTEQTQPTEAEIEEEIVRLKAQDVALAYQAKRRAEYPPIQDYLDGVVKGDTAQVDAYIVKCLAIKAKYPKG